MARAASLPCPACEGLAVRVVETREDPEHPYLPTVWRLHECRDCGERFASAQNRVRMADALARLEHLARERYILARAGRRPPATPLGAR
jgi:transcriptional regulator NrdR family protein